MSSERQKAVRQADKAFSEYVRKRDGYRCYTCGHMGRKGDGIMQVGHLITRGKYSVRWDDDNAACQCRSCNMRHEYQPEHFTDRYIRDRGIEAYHALVLRSNKPRKWTTQEIRDIAAYYQRLTREVGDLYG